MSNTVAKTLGRLICFFKKHQWEPVPETVITDIYLPDDKDHRYCQRCLKIEEVEE